MTIQQYQGTVDEWIKEYGVRYFSEMTNTVLLMEETGELARLIARLYGEQSFKEGVKLEDPKQAVADEMADVVFVLTCLANQMGIDLSVALQRNLQKKTTRDHQRHKQNDKLSGTHDE